MAKIMRLETFVKSLGEELQFFKGKGRAFAPTKIGTIFVSNSYVASKPGWILEHSGGEGYEHLRESLWLCNTGLTEYDIKHHKPAEPKAKGRGK
jgi:hypothetical protein